MPYRKFLLTNKSKRFIIISNNDERKRFIMLLNVDWTKLHNEPFSCDYMESRSLRRVSLLTSYEDWT